MVSVLNEARLFGDWDCEGLPTLKAKGKGARTSLDSAPFLATLPLRTGAVACRRGVTMTVGRRDSTGRYFMICINPPGVEYFVILLYSWGAIPLINRSLPRESAPKILLK